MAKTTTLEDEQETENVPARTNGNGMLLAMSNRQAQEVQAAMTIAKRFPRDETVALARITQACRRKKLAEVSQYVFPRGGTQVTGPSIRLAEVLAQSWGNIESGVVELERRDGVSTAMAYCWDLETNTRDVKVFEVRHIRDTRSGPKRLTDERDIYEMVANVGARRKRACILAVIPGDVQESAIEECDKTIEGDNKEPLIDRVRRLVVAFNDLGISQEMIEKRLQHKVDATVYQEFSALYKIYQSVKDGMASREQFFEVVPAAKATTTIDDLAGESPPSQAEPDKTGEKPPKGKNGKDKPQGEIPF